MLKVLLISFSLLSATNWTDEERKTALVNLKESGLTQTEKEVIYYINLARINPQKFLKITLNPYLRKHTSYSKKYIKSLKRDLANQAPLLPLNHQQNLHLFAKHHSKTTGKAGKVGHQSVGFKNYTKRTKKLIKIYSYLGENIHYGSTDAKEIIIDLLIDDGIKNLGHRKNILSSTFIYVSTSIQPHKKYGQNCVIEFGGSLN